MSDIHVEQSDPEVEEPAAAHEGHPSAREYVRIFFILGAITGIEVAIYYVREQMGGWFLPVLFALMISKFAIVVLWYMHLKFDDRRFARFFVMGLAGAATLYLVVLISFKVFLD
ncbi:MAG: cytochrome C oxidase subunit IV family protein [Actinomycetota bacterium]